MPMTSSEREAAQASFRDAARVLNDKLRTPPNVTLINLPPRTAA